MPGPEDRPPTVLSLAGRPVGKAEVQAAYRVNALLDAYRDGPLFGYRFLVDEAGDAGEPMSAVTAWRICPGR